MGEYKFEIGQRVNVEGDDTGTVTYRCNAKQGATVYMVRPDGSDWEFLRGERFLSPAPLVRGSVVRREQADSIPAGTVVSDRHSRLWQRRPDDEGEDGFPWLRFGIRDGFSNEYLHWPVTVVEPAGDDE
jgi:hypothetical protein